MNIPTICLLDTKTTNKSTKAKNTTRGRGSRGPLFSVPPVVIQTLKRVKGLMNHSYRDFSKVPPLAGYQPVSVIEDMTFAQRVHTMLEACSETDKKEAHFATR